MIARLIRPVSAVALAALVTAAVVATPNVAHAQETRSMMLELHVGPYTPEIDSAVSGSPYAESFSGSDMWQLGLGLDYQFWQKVGTFAVGIGWKYGWVDGTSVETGTSDETALNMMPFTAGITYRFDYLAVEFGIPLVPYFKGGFEWVLWWVTNGRNEIANTWGGPKGDEERTGMGGTFGFYGSVGLQLLLDWFSPSMARSFQTETGVNNSYLFVELTRHEVNDFYSETSIDLSSTAVSFGLMFEF